MHPQHRLLIEASPRQVLPALARAVRAAGGSWRLRVFGQAVVWLPESQDEAPFPGNFSLEPGQAAGTSLVKLVPFEECPADEARLAAVLQEVSHALKKSGFKIEALPEEVPPDVVPNGAVTKPPAQAAESVEKAPVPPPESVESPDLQAEAADETAEPSNEPAEPTAARSQTVDESAEPPDEVAEAPEEGPAPPPESAESPDLQAEAADEPPEPPPDPAQPSDAQTEPFDGAEGPVDGAPSPPDPYVEAAGEAAEAVDEGPQPAPDAPPSRTATEPAAGDDGPAEAETGAPHPDDAAQDGDARMPESAAGAQPASEAGAPHEPRTAEKSRGTALFLAPANRPYTALIPHVKTVLSHHGLQLHHLPIEQTAAAKWRHAVTSVALVIGVWSSQQTRAALYHAWAYGRPAIALAPEEDEASDWPGPTVYYGRQRGAFLTALEQTLRKDFAQPFAIPESEEQQDDALQAERRRIYGRVARDRFAPLEQRFHAARVLSQSGDRASAARVLASVVMAKGAGTLADDALRYLGSLGAAARPALWYLDAQPMSPARAVEVARQLAHSSDKQTALLRLERLSQNADEAVWEKAIEALAEVGEPARPNFLTLARSAANPELRLRAAQWLVEQGEAEQVTSTLVKLASQTEEAELSRAAVDLLGQVRNEEATQVLLTIAQQSPSVDARLAAAEVLNREGDTGAARAVLLSLAQGTDDLAAGAALDMLVNVSDKVMTDTERLMNSASLKSVRRRAAEILSQPHQPEPVQQAAARVFLALDRPAMARPILGRLAQSEENLDIARWAAQQLAQIGESALDHIRAAFARPEDPIVGQYLAEGLLEISNLPDDRRQAAIWLAEHSNLPRGVEVLGDLALSARVSGSDAVKATDDLNRYAGRWAGAARVLATLANDSPHPAVRSRALDLLLREHPSELPLSLLVDLAVTGSIGAADRSPVMHQLAVLAKPAATNIATRLSEKDVDTERRWQLLQLMNELPDSAVMPALLQLSTRAPQNRVRYVAAEQLIARGQISAGYAALATIAITSPEWVLRERALYELAQGLPETKLLLQSVIDRTRYEDTFLLARDLLYTSDRSIVVRTNYWMDRQTMRWHSWVAGLPLGWLDRLLGLFRRRR